MAVLPGVHAMTSDIRVLLSGCSIFTSVVWVVQEKRSNPVDQSIVYARCRRTIYTIRNIIEVNNLLCLS
jgi:hypothetical protein